MIAWLLVAWVWIATLMFVAGVALGPDRLGALVLRCLRRRPR